MNNTLSNLQDLEKKKKKKETNERVRTVAVFVHRQRKFNNAPLPTCIVQRQKV